MNFFSDDFGKKKGRKNIEEVVGQFVFQITLGTEFVINYKRIS